MARAVAMLVPLRTPASEPCLRLSSPAPAPTPPEAFMPSMAAASRSSSLGYECSARSYLRDMGRKTWAATCCAWSIRGFSFLGTSRFIMLSSSNVERAFNQRNGAHMPVPKLNWVLLHEAVLTQELNAI